MAIFRRRKEDSEPDLPHVEDPDEPASPDDEAFPSRPIDEWALQGRGSKAARGFQPPPVTPTDDDVRSLEQRLLASLRPGQRPVAPSEERPAPTPSVETPAEPVVDRAPAEPVVDRAPAALLKDRPSRPNPGTDIHRAIRRAVTRALSEDLGDQGDLTASATILPGARGTATLVAREAGVLAGLELVTETYTMLDSRVTVQLHAEDGDRVEAGQQIGVLAGPLRSILTGERVALNFLGHLSGIATTTAAYVDAVAGTKAVIRDTRKTTPGLRLLEKMAVVAGGGVNHRLGLFDALLVKDNHNLGAGGVASATRRAIARANGRPVQVEVTSIEEMDAAVAAGATDVMLDNFDLEMLEIAAARAPAEVMLEASGGVTLDNVADVAATGVGRIAIGALTHSAARLDVALDVTVVAADRPSALAALSDADLLDDDLVDDFVVEADQAAEPLVDEAPAPEGHGDEDTDPVDAVEDSAAFHEEGAFPADEEELDDDLFDVRPWSSVDDQGDPRDGEVVPLDAAAPGSTGTRDDLMNNLGLRGDTALEDLAGMDDDVPVPDDDVVDAFLDELDRDEGAADTTADETRD